MKAKILVAGDSIGKGVVYDEKRRRYVHSAKGFCDLLTPYMAGALYNTARFGQTIGPGLERLSRDIKSIKPDMVWIEFGGNDCNFNWEEVAAAPDKTHIPATPISEYEDTLDKLIWFCIEQGATPVLMSLPPLDAERFFTWVGKDEPMRANILKWLGTVMQIYWWHEQYSVAVQQAALRHGLACIDIRRAFLSQGDIRPFLCVDGMHPNEAGHCLIARACLDYIKDTMPEALLAKKEQAPAIPLYPRLNCL